MEISARSVIALVLFALQFSTVRAQPTARDCGVSIDFPAGVEVKRDSGAQAPLCTYLEASTKPTPFVNSVTEVPWAKLESLQVNGRPMRDIGFFRLTRRLSVTYLGRPSYVDARNAYAQRVVEKSSRRQTSGDGKTTLVARSELRVKWLKPVDTDVQEETTESFSCIDAAISDSAVVVTVNWCLLKGDRGIDGLANAIRHIRLNVH